MRRNLRYSTRLKTVVLSYAMSQIPDFTGTELWAGAWRSKNATVKTSNYNRVREQYRTGRDSYTHLAECVTALLQARPITSATVI